MPQRYPPVNPKCPHFLYGGDYNPDQWINTPGIWDEDMRLMKLAGVNAASVGIFSWMMYEPQEGQFQFDWLDRVMDNLAKNGIYAVLATPSGAKPIWMALKYPEIRRVTLDGHRELQGGRHNHCYTSPVYREKVCIINTKLAERYQNHPALLMWHLSNEYGGECHCDLCKAAFRQWLKKKYGSIEALNQAWWSTFWSHNVTDWSQVDQIDYSHHGLIMDWKRFINDQTVDFMKHEIEPLKRFTPNTPVTTNMMTTHHLMNYWKFAPWLDVASWDSYPPWHTETDELRIACSTSFVHDLYRSLKGGKPFVLMESTPSQVNSYDISPLKRPGMNKLSSLQAVAHGADAVMYFQWRKGRGAFEKFHGAVVDHAGHRQTRVFRECAELGHDLTRLEAILGTSVRPEVAIIYDWENAWGVNESKGPRNRDKNYQQTCEDFYRPLWSRSVSVDVIESLCDFSQYRLLIAPMLYMLRPGVAERIAAFVQNGGVFVTTYFSGIADENDLCFLGGFPGPLRPVLRIWSEELDVLRDQHSQIIVAAENNALGLTGHYAVRHYCDLIQPEGAQILATYGTDFYAGRAALTVSQFGKGRAFYIASRNDARFQDDFLAALIRQLQLRRTIACDLPTGVTAQRRTDGKREYVFLMNFNPDPRLVDLADKCYQDLLNNSTVQGKVPLAGYGVLVLEQVTDP